MNIGIGLLLPIPVEKIVETEKQKLSKYRNKSTIRQPPHIAVKWSFSTKDIQPFSAYCLRLAEKTAPLNLSYEGIGYFEPRVVYIKVKKDRQLLNLHLKILRNLRAKFGVKKKSFEGKKAVFHTSLLLGKFTKKRFEELKSLTSERLKGTRAFKVSSIALFYRRGKTWKIYEKYLLKGSS